MANAFEIHFPIQILYRSLYNNGMIIDNNNQKNKKKDVWMSSSSVQNKIYFVVLMD